MIVLSAWLTTTIFVAECWGVCAWATGADRASRATASRAAIGLDICRAPSTEAGVLRGGFAVRPLDSWLLGARRSPTWGKLSGWRDKVGGAEILTGGPVEDRCDWTRTCGAGERRLLR